MPKFTMVLQTSPKDAPGEYVNSLPPIKSPAEGLISGDTVPEKWVAEVATMEDIQKLLNKHVEELNTRIAALEAKVNELSPKTESQAENKQEPKSEAKLEAKVEQKTEVKSEQKPEQKAEQKSEQKSEQESEPKAEKKEESKTEGKPEQKADAAKAK